MKSGLASVVASVVVALAIASTGGGAPPDEPPVRRAVRPLAASAHGVGGLVADLPFSDLAGVPHRVGERSTDGSLTVFAATSTSCPASRRYLPTLVAFAAAADARIGFVLVDAIATDAPEAMRAAAERFAGRGVYVHDPDGRLARGVGLTTTTDVVVIDAARTVVYHGAVDDQYGPGYALDAPAHRHLADALAALLAGRDPPVAATEAPGCDLDRVADADAQATSAAQPTWHGRISRIVQRSCGDCHREGGTGPFALESLDDVAGHAGMIRSVVADGTMPPWFAAPTDAQAPASPWANDRSLTAADRRDLLAWLAGGRPAGDPADAPLPRRFESDWAIGVPDAVYEFPRPVAVKAEGTMPYQHVTIETGLPEDRWVTAIEVRPGNPAVVHHALVHVDAGAGPAGEREGFWAEYVPGQSVLEFPAGFAKRLPKGARLVFQMHYTPVGTATTDRTRIGVRFATAPPRHEVRVAAVSRRDIAIPPHAPNHREEASLALPFDATILGFLPHMHLRGKACRYELDRADGTTTTLLDIPRYDFNWQLLYRYREPLPLRAGDTLRFAAWYDNSAGNPANPDPSRLVRWGQQTFDEMHLGYVEFFVPGEVPGKAPARDMNRPQRPGEPGFDVEAAFRRLDRDGDGRLVAAEWPAKHRPLLERLDADDDGVVTLGEARAGLAAPPR